MNDGITPKMKTYRARVRSLMLTAVAHDADKFVGTVRASTCMWRCLDDGDSEVQKLNEDF